MKQVIVSALLVSAFGTYTWNTTEAATTAKKVPAIEAKRKKATSKEHSMRAESLVLF